MLFLGVALLVTQCQKDHIEKPQQVQKSIPGEITKGLNIMGFNTKDYKVLQKEGGYIVEGDIYITTSTILDQTSMSSKHR